MYELDFDLLKAHAIKKPKEFLYSHPEYKLSFLESIYLKYFIFLYKKGFSVAAITGHKEFYGLDFFVNKHVLIPRPDTELMVESVVQSLKSKVQSPVTLIDVGTGSGCIPIAIIKTLKHENIKTFATDISRSALRVAKKNAKKHGVKINFLRGNLLQPICHPERDEGSLSKIGRDSSVASLPQNDIVITANLPYLTLEQFQNEPSIQREPKTALVADSDGLALYEKLLRQIKSLFIIHYSSFIILFEIDPSQTEEISKLIKQYLPQAKIETKKDLAGRDRLVKITMSC